MLSRELRVLSLFSGIGGFEVAMEMLGGFQVTDAVERNPFRQKILKKRFRNLKIHENVKTYRPDKYFDLVVFGSPCQDLSCAGGRAGITGNRSILFFDALRIVEECQPAFIVWENVPNAVNQGLRAVLGSFRLAGYHTETQIVSAKELGAPHKRERLFVLAYTHSIKQTWRDFVPLSWERQVRNSIALVADSSSFRQPAQRQSTNLSGKNRLSSSKHNKQTGAFPQSRRYSLPCCEINSRWTQFSSSPQRMDDGFSHWLDGLGKRGYWANSHYFPPQITTPRYSVPDRQARISALGDAVCPLQAMIPLLRIKYLNEFGQLTV